MSPTALIPCLPAALRATLVAAAATLLARGISAGLAALPDSRRRLAWGLLLIPALTPPILTGYASSDLALVALDRPRVREAAYAVLLVLRFTPLAVLVLHLTWTGLAAEARHCNRLLAPRTPAWRQAARALRLWLQGSCATLGVAFALVFLLAFMEFDLASFFLVNQWTITLFDLQLGGTPVSESLRHAVAPLAIGAVAMAAGLACLPQLRRRREHANASPLGRLAGVALWTYLGGATVAVTLAPGAAVLENACAGLRPLVTSFGLQREIAASILFAGAAAFLAWQLVTWGARLLPGASRTARAAAALLALPGLLGPLVISLVCLRLFQAPLLRAVYDSPLPLLAALTASLLPIAFLLRLALDHGLATAAYHAARLLHAAADPPRRRAARRLCWRLGARRGFWLACILFGWAYFDVTASAMLAPAAMPPLMPRLYNFMHYGRSAVLSAMLAVAMAVPVMVMALIHPGWRRWGPLHE